MERESIKSIRNMRVMCIERSTYMDQPRSEFNSYTVFSIEVGDWLEVHDNSKVYKYYTFDKNGQRWFAEKNKFITVKQWRQKQLNKLL